MGLSGNNDNKQGLVRVIKPTANACRNRVDGFFICSVQKIMTIVFSFDFGRIDLERGKNTRSIHSCRFPRSCRNTSIVGINLILSNSYGTPN